MGLFDPAPLSRAQICLQEAQRAVITAQRNCTLAKVALEDAGRDTQAAAISMICASLEQSERDIVQWHDMTQKTRENGNGET